MSPSRLAFVCVFTFVLAFELADASWAQLPSNSSTTSTPTPGAGHDYLGGPAETVNPANGSISFRLPVIMPVSRGITLPFSFAYDSNGVNYLKMASGSGTGFWNTIGSVSSQAGWSNTVPLASTSLLTWQTLINGGPRTETCKALVNFVFQDPSGHRHNLNLTNYSFVGAGDSCDINSNDWPILFEEALAYSGAEGPIAGSIPSFWTATPSVTVTDGDGTTFNFSSVGNGTKIVSSIVDRNGNTINVSSNLNSGHASFSYVDTTGRTVLQDSGFGASPETVTISGLGAAYTLNWASASTPSFSTPITTLAGSCTTTHNNWNGVTDVSSISLPNGQSYSFSYDST